MDTEKVLSRAAFDAQELLELRAELVLVTDGRIADRYLQMGNDATLVALVRYMDKEWHWEQGRICVGAASVVHRHNSEFAAQATGLNSPARERLAEQLAKRAEANHEKANAG